VDVESYLSGYADGEGCFCVSVNPSRRHRFGWEIRPSFSVSQNADRAAVLQVYKDQWQCGSIRPDRSDRTLKYEVRSIRELVTKVIPHFERCELISSKRNDFNKFSEVCRLLDQKAHLTQEGFQRVLTLAGQINLTGKKKFPRKEIKI
jgi:hypothetical protein